MSASTICWSVSFSALGRLEGGRGAGHVHGRDAVRLGLFDVDDDRLPGFGERVADDEDGVGGRAGRGQAQAVELELLLLACICPKTSRCCSMDTMSRKAAAKLSLM